MNEPERMMMMMMMMMMVVEMDAGGQGGKGAVNPCW